jgi:serine/threonine protein kinase
LLRHFWLIGDLGLSQPANNTLKNNEIYGVIPYIAPEVFKDTKFSKESDIYSFGMIMWELTTGCKPFANVEHDVNLIYKIIDGRRPEITQDTPECFANLMKECWDSNPSKRPTIDNIRSFIRGWFFADKLGNRNYDKFHPEFKETFDQAEKKRLELIQSKKLGPEFSEETHPKAIYTSRAVSSLISKSSTINSSINSFSIKQGKQGILF